MLILPSKVFTLSRGLLSRLYLSVFWFVLVGLSSCGILFSDDKRLDSERDVLSGCVLDAEASIRSAISEDWIVSVRGRVILLESKFKVYRIQSMARQYRMPELDSSTAVLEKEAVPEKYIIKLEFEESLSQDEFVRRRMKKRELVDVLNFGTTSSEDWRKAIADASKIRVPRYRLGYCDIYRVLETEGVGRRIYPLDAISRIGAAKEILDALFKPMESEYD